MANLLKQLMRANVIFYIGASLFAITTFLSKSSSNSTLDFLNTAGIVLMGVGASVLAFTVVRKGLMR